METRGHNISYVCYVFILKMPKNMKVKTKNAFRSPGNTLLRSSLLGM
jgi:hypothetical protein